MASDGDGVTGVVVKTVAVTTVVLENLVVGKRLFDMGTDEINGVETGGFAPGWRSPGVDVGLDLQTGVGILSAPSPRASLVMLQLTKSSREVLGTNKS